MRVYKCIHTGKKLWGDEDDIKQLNLEKTQEAEAKLSKSKKKNDIVKRHNGFFAFNNEQFMSGYNKLKENGIIEDGEKVVHVIAGLYIPKSKVDSFLKEYKKSGK